MVLLEFLPELAAFDLLSGFRSSEVELLRDSTSEVN